MAKRTVIPALDGLRGIAILAVMVFHFVSGLPIKDSPVLKLVYVLCTPGWMGVDLFFVLSGFLITRILLEAKEHGSAPTYFRNFYVRRFLRIFPLYYGLLAILFMVVPRLVSLDSDSLSVFRRQGWLWLYAMNVEAALRSHWLFDLGIYRVSHLWSLSVEEHFYLVWPLIVWMAPARSLRVLSVAVCVAVLGLRTVLVLGHAFPYTVYAFTACRIDAMCMGAFLAALGPDGALSSLVRYAKYPLAWLAVFVAGVLARDHLFIFLAPAVQTVGLTLAYLASAALLVLALVPSAFSRTLARPLPSFFGKYSYGMYVLHFPLIDTFQALFYWPIAHRGYHTLAALVFVLLSLLSTATLAFVVWHLYEKPFLRLKSHFEYREADVPVVRAA